MRHVVLLDWLRHHKAQKDCGLKSSASRSRVFETLEARLVLSVSPLIPDSIECRSLVTDSVESTLQQSPDPIAESDERGLEGAIDEAFAHFGSDSSLFSAADSLGGIAPSDTDGLGTAAAVDQVMDRLIDSGEDDADVVSARAQTQSPLTTAFNSIPADPQPPTADSSTESADRLESEAGTSRATEGILSFSASDRADMRRARGPPTSDDAISQLSLTEGLKFSPHHSPRPDNSLVSRTSGEAPGSSLRPPQSQALLSPAVHSSLDPAHGITSESASRVGRANYQHASENAARVTHVPVSGAGASRTLGNPEFTLLSIGGELDRSHPQLMRALERGDSFDSVDLEVTTFVGDQQQAFLSYRLSNAIVVNYDLNAAAGGRLIPRYDLQFEQVDVTYSHFDSAGQPLGESQFRWNSQDGKLLEQDPNAATAKHEADPAGQSLSNAQTIFVQFPDIPGNSMIGGREDWSEVANLQFNFVRPIGPQAEPRFAELSISSDLAENSPLLQQAMARGDLFPSVQFEVVAELEGSPVFYRLEAGDVLISSYSVQGDAGGVFEQHYTLSVGAIDVVYTEFNGAGTPVDQFVFSHTPPDGSSLAAARSVRREVTPTAGQPLTFASRIFVRFDGLKGESTEVNHVEWSDVSSIGHFYSAPVVGSGRLRTRLPLSVGNLSMVAPLDRISPTLASMLTDGAVVKTVEMDVTAQTEAGLVTFYAYELSNVAVASYSVQGSAGVGLIQSYELSFDELQVTFTKFDDSGVRQEDIEFTLQVPSSAGMRASDLELPLDTDNRESLDTQALSVADSIFVRFEGLKGEVQEPPSFLGWSRVESVDYDLFLPIAGSGGAREFGQAMLSDLRVASDFDRIGPSLAEAAALGTVIPEVEVHVTATPLNEEVSSYTIQLRNVLLTDYGIFSRSGEKLQHSYSLNFDRMDVSYVEFDSSGRSIGEVLFVGVPGEGAVAVTGAGALADPTPLAVGQQLISPSAVFVRFEDIEGEVTVKGYEGWSEVVGFDQSIGVAVTGIGRDRQREELQFSEFFLSGLVDRTSPLLEEALVQGRVFDTVEVHALALGADDILQPFYRHELQSVQLLSYGVGGDAKQRLDQRYGLTFDSITSRYTEFDEAGVPVEDVVFSFDIPRESRPTALPRPAGITGPPHAPAAAAILKQEELDSIVQAATQQWAAAGADTAPLRGTSVLVTSLSSGKLGIAFPNQVLIDDNGAGHGWFIDGTPAQTEEFANGRAIGSGDAAGKMDLLTVVAHELGHVLGLEHLPATSIGPGVMHHSLSTGQRRLPEPSDVHEITDKSRRYTSPTGEALWVDAPVMSGVPPAESNPVISHSANHQQAYRPDPKLIATADDAGDSELQFRLQVVDLSGEPLTSVEAGSEFVLQGFVADVRGDPQGVFSAYLDVSYAAELVVPSSEITYGTRFSSVQTGELLPGLIDEVGALTLAPPADTAAEELLFRVMMRAVVPGTVDFLPDPSETSALESLFFDSTARIPDDRMSFLGTRLDVVSRPFRVEMSNLADAQLRSFPTNMTLQFSDEVDLSTVEPTDVLVNGVPAVNVSALDERTLEFDITSADAGDGEYEIFVEADSISSVFGQLLEAYAATFLVTADAPLDPLVSIRLQAVDPAGDMISTIGVGREFELQGFVTDLRANPFGVFSAYLDVIYEAERVRLIDEVTFGPRFPFGSSISTPGLLDEVGAFAESTDPADGAEELLFSVRVVAQRVGTVNFRPDPSDVLPLHEVTLIGVDTAISDDRVEFLGTAVEIVELDFGDAPPSYATVLTDAGPHHSAVGPALGAARDTEFDGQPTGGADGDDFSGVDDEDGVALGTIQVGQLDSLATVEITGGPARLDAWIDFNRDGSWGGPFEQIADSVDIPDGSTLLEFDVPSWAAAGTTFARFRLSSEGDLAPTGGALDGEVEDYELAIDPPNRSLGRFGSGQLVSNASGGARSLFSGDVDGDGDLDVLSASYYGGTIAWHENGPGQDFGLPQPISGDAEGAWDVVGADVDGDGDLDVLSASPFENTVAWYENVDGQGVFGPRRVISQTATTAASVFVADLDSDGDQDLLAASTVDNTIEWYENLDGLGTFSAEQVVTNVADDVLDVFAADLDRDGDVDVLSASVSDDTIAWYENRLNQIEGDFAPQRVISDSVSRASLVVAVDFDLDGDLDVLSGSRDGSEIVWHENRLNAEGGFSPQQVISSEPVIATSVFAADVDGDGDPDVLSASAVDDTIAWYENRSAGEAVDFGPRQVISTVEQGAQSVFAGDLDGDGDLDVLSASADDNTIRWFENLNSQLELAVNADEPPTELVDEGSQALRRGTFDYMGRGSVIWTASLGSVTSDDVTGTWVWTYTPSDNLPEPQPVTVTATAADDDLEARVMFDLVVSNVAPISVDLTATRGDGEEENTVTLSGAFLDPGDDSHTVEVAWGDGTVEGVDHTDRAFSAVHTYGNSDEVLIQVTVTDDDGAATVDEIIVEAVSREPEVISFAFSRTGFEALLDRDLDEATISGFAPVNTVLQGTLGGPVAGSLIVDSSLRKVTFVKTGGLLAPDNYTAVLRGVGDGLGMDGGKAKGPIRIDADFVALFTIDEPAAGAIAVGLPDFLRGPGQEVNLPADTTDGIPLTLSDGAGVRSVELTISYDPALLTITGGTVAAGLPEGATVDVDAASPGTAVVSFLTPADLPAGARPFVHLTADVPTANANQIYLGKQVIDVHSLTIRNGSDVSLPGISDDAVHLATYPGDVSGNARLNAFDASVAARVASLIDPDFSAARLVDPILIGDVSGNGRLNASDASRIARAGALIPIPEIPPIPPGVVTRPTPIGPDPKLSIPQDLVAQAGQVVSVPVLIDSVVDLQVPHRLAAADVVLVFDPQVLTVTSVTAGDFMTSRRSWGFVPNIDNQAGRIVIAAFTAEPVSGTFAGELVNIEFAVSPAAPSGTSSLNLVDGAGGAGTDLIDEHDGALELDGPVTNAPTDPVDGVLTVTTRLPLADFIWLQVGDPSEPDQLAVELQQRAPVFRSDPARGRQPVSESDVRISFRDTSLMDAVIAGHVEDLLMDDVDEWNPVIGTVEELLAARVRG